MSKVLVIGNLCWDMPVYLGGHLVSGGAIPVLSSSLGPGRPGGSAANVARGLASAGHSVDLIAAVGQDREGRDLLADLDMRGVSRRWVRSYPGQTRSCFILIEPDGERTILTSPGVSTAPPAGLHVMDMVSEGYDLVFFGLTGDRWLPLARKLVEAGVYVASALRSPIPEGFPVDLVVESREIIPNSGLTESDIPERFASVILTDGARGGTWHGPDGAHQFPSVPAQSRDATGAGDAFASGVLHGVLRGVPMPEAIEIGARWGAMATEIDASAPPPWGDVRRFTAVAGRV